MDGRHERTAASKAFRCSLQCVVIRNCRIRLSVSGSDASRAGDRWRSVSWIPGDSRSRFAICVIRCDPLVLQGRYMGYMRQLKPRQKAQVRKVRDVKGVRSAIRKAREFARA